MELRICRLSLLFGVLLYPAIVYSQQRETSPLVGKWDYGESGCSLGHYREWGYVSEDAALASGIRRSGIDACGAPTIYRIADWATTTQRSYHHCVASLPASEYLNIETASDRGYFLQFNNGSNCEQANTTGISIWRKRQVYCPLGYRPSYYSPTNTWTCYFGGLINLNKNNDSCTVGNNGSNPIHTALGIKIQREEDIDVGAGLRFNRVYSSASHWQKTEIGNHWRHNLSASVSFWDGALSSASATAWVQRPNGDLLAFNRVGENGWIADPDVTLSLSAVLTAQGQIEGWVIRDINAQIEVYDVIGRLIALESPSHGVRTLSYDQENGRLKTFTDRHGRALRFEYDSYGRIHLVIDPAGQIYEYSYDAAGNLSAVEYPSSVEGQSSIRSYNYGNSRYPYALTGINDESGSRYASWSYDHLISPDPQP